MKKYNGKFKNLVAKKDFVIGDSSSLYYDIAIFKGDKCTCVEYDKTHDLSATEEALPYKVVFENIEDSIGNNAIQWFSKYEIEDIFDIVV